MKKSTSITFKETTINTINELCDRDPLDPSFSQMAELLINTNPKFTKHEKGKNKKVVKKNK